MHSDSNRHDKDDRKKRFKTLSGVELSQTYGPSEFDSGKYYQKLGDPGCYPYTRGIQETMYRGKLWTMRQYAGFGSAAETNERFKYLLGNGQTGLSVAFDLPTQIGLDSDNAWALGEVGKVGVAIDSIDDMETLLADIPLDRVSTSMTINATAPVLLALYIAVARRRGIELNQLQGTIQNDILKEYIARGTYIYPPKPSLRLITDVFEYCQREVPKWNTISISGYHIREAGSTAIQELAFTLGNAIAYVEAALSRGMEIDQFAPRLSFFFNAHIDFLEEIAKFRAARRLWSRITRERFEAKNERSQAMRFHAQTAGSSLTAQFPDANIVRVTLQALAAVLGGAQSVHTNSKDEALALPREDAARLALRTQQLIAHESGVVNTVDPVGGSFALEALTERLEMETLNYLEKIDSLGGMLAAIESGFVQKEIQEAAYNYQCAVESGERVIVGVNRYESTADDPISIHRVRPELEREQVRRLASIRGKRDSNVTAQAIEKLEAAARDHENVMPYIINAVEALATVGEISDTFRRVFGEYKEVVTI